MDSAREGRAYNAEYFVQCIIMHPQRARAEGRARLGLFTRVIGVTGVVRVVDVPGFCQG